MTGEIPVIGKAVGRPIYTLNFEKGVDTKKFRYYPIVLWSLLGIVAGAVLGAGVDAFGNRTNWSFSRTPKEYAPPILHKK